MTVFVDAQPKKAHYRSFTVSGLEGQDDFASMGQVIARRFARLRDAATRPLRRELRVDPEPRRDRRRQGAAGGGARGDAGDGRRCRAWPSSRWRSERRRCSSLDAPTRSCSIRHDPGLQLLQRIRDEAHRFAITHHRQKRDTRAFESIFDTLDGIGPVAAAGDPAALRLGRPLPGGIAGGARGGARASGEDGAVRVRAAPPDGRAGDVSRGGYGSAGRRRPWPPEAERPEGEQDRGEPERRR